MPPASNQLLNRKKVEKEYRKIFLRTLMSFIKTIPLLLAIIMLISLLHVFVPPSLYSHLFIGNVLWDSFIGALVGSIAAGNPITSYILGGELLKEGVMLVAVLSFLLAWVTVGVVQLPAESALLGKKFAIVRNIVSFTFAIIIASLVVMTLHLI